MAGTSAGELWTPEDQSFIASIRDAAMQFVSAMRDRDYGRLWFQLMTGTGRDATSAYAANAMLRDGVTLNDIPAGGTYASWVSVLLNHNIRRARSDFFEGIRKSQDELGLFEPGLQDAVFACRGGYMVLFQLPSDPYMFPIAITPDAPYKFDMETYLVGSAVVTVQALLVRGLQFLREKTFVDAASQFEAAERLGRAHQILQEPPWQRLFNQERRGHLASDSQLLSVASARLVHARHLASLSIQTPIPDDVLLRSRVFLSHSSSDNEFCRRLAASLSDLGVKVWYDDWEIKVGDSIVDKVNQGLEEHDYLCVVLSEASVQSEWVRKEINAGFVRGIREKRAVLLPVRLDGCKVPPLLEDIRAADFRDDFFMGLSELVRSFAGDPDPQP